MGSSRRNRPVTLLLPPSRRIDLHASSEDATEVRADVEAAGKDDFRDRSVTLAREEVRGLPDRSS